MRKRLIYFILASFMVAFTLTGCNDVTITLVNSHMRVPVGEELSNDPADYVRASQTMLEQMSVDVSAVDVNSIGSYKAYVDYNGESRKFTVEVADMSAPAITLKSTDIYFELSGTVRVDDVVTSVTDYSDYDYGFSDDMTAADQNKNMVQSLSFDTLGDYHCEVIARDEYNNISVAGFTVHVVAQGEIPAGSLQITDFSPYMNIGADKSVTDTSVYSSEGVYYGIGKEADTATNRPALNYYIDKYKGFAVDFIQPESSFVWLTFNEIGEYGNTEKILDTLKEKNVSAVFFITLGYAKNNPDLVKRMLDEGHVLGNYTANGVNVPDLSLKELTSEIDELYNYVYQTYGYEMYLFRAPSGYYSEQSLAVAQSLGYRTVFWSFAYADWDVDNQPSVSEALKNAVDKAHGGAIYLLSGSSSTNQKMLGDMIDGIREKKLEFAVYQNNQ